VGIGKRLLALTFPREADNRAMHFMKAVQRKVKTSGRLVEFRYLLKEVVDKIGSAPEERHFRMLANSVSSV
jgi:protein-disulfide isomerase-like protein with CxxC motif